ncbi:hypothetical protein SAMN06264364_11856 [Quadrisphaera granulorum]|uniref:DUF5666 domain-containing protein n=1 Tax=Quadrisphaera granulorum TaxID=317664 RepID=A0A316A4R2_9ACTN|nr:hypothetical protein [Quadrisphaera granulorum]PWJ52685.1 hypothetical protein BXY45_11856 [Quadrisphaera granulorum]SZE97507.1 hypothetical protein SAMN06264364_11856 [Quadrisphaera granulorum]
MNEPTQPTWIPGADASDEPVRAGRQPHQSRRGRRTLVAVALAGGLAVGGAGVALADGTPAASSPSSSSSSAAADGAPQGGPTAGPGAEQHEHQPHLDGTVKEVSDSGFTLVDRDGFTRTVSTTGSTTYTSAPTPPAPPAAPSGQQGSQPEASAQPEAPAQPATADRSSVLVVGARVMAEGSVASDGTTLDATTVSTAPEPPAGGPAGPPASPASRTGQQGGPARDGGPQKGAKGDKSQEAPAAEAPAAPAAPASPAAPGGGDQPDVQGS